MLNTKSQALEIGKDKEIGRIDGRQNGVEEKEVQPPVGGMLTLSGSLVFHTVISHGSC